MNKQLLTTLKTCRDLLEDVSILLDKNVLKIEDNDKILYSINNIQDTHILFKYLDDLENVIDYYDID